MMSTDGSRRVSTIPTLHVVVGGSDFNPETSHYICEFSLFTSVHEANASQDGT